MAALVTVLSAPLMRKLASLKEVRERLIPNIPRDMAVKVVGELQDHELNFGNPNTDLEPVAVDIGRISGNLSRSFGFKQINPQQWAVMQTLALAPYAGDVADYAKIRFGMTYLDSVRRRTADYLIKGAKEEWEYAFDRIENDRPYKYHPLYGE